jgi:4-aminobutyrate--pyruvate transaminase
VGVSDTIYEQMLEPDAMFMHGFTYSGHPVGCAVGLANIDIIESENLPANAKEQGAYLLSRLEELLGHQNVGEVRGKGLMMIVELVKDKRSREPLTGIVGPLLAATRKRGLIISASDMGISLSPPLILTKEDADQIVDALQGAIVEVFG